MSKVIKSLQVLAAIADAYDANALDDGARKFWGMDNEHQNTMPHEQIGLCLNRGGKHLLTLADCMVAREALTELCKTRKRKSNMTENDSTKRAKSLPLLVCIGSDDFGNRGVLFAVANEQTADEIRSAYRKLDDFEFEDVVDRLVEAGLAEHRG
jgi:hypothetical protein